MKKKAPFLQMVGFSLTLTFGVFHTAYAQNNEPYYPKEITIECPNPNNAEVKMNADNGRSYSLEVRQKLTLPPAQQDSPAVQQTLSLTFQKILQSIQEAVTPEVEVTLLWEGYSLPLPPKACKDSGDPRTISYIGFYTDEHGNNQNCASWQRPPYKSPLFPHAISTTSGHTLVCQYNNYGWADSDYTHYGDTQLSLTSIIMHDFAVNEMYNFPSIKDNTACGKEGEPPCSITGTLKQ
jgi:hypothetical protein